MYIGIIHFVSFFLPRSRLSIKRDQRERRQKRGRREGGRRESENRTKTNPPRRAWGGGGGGGRGGRSVSPRIVAAANSRGRGDGGGEEGKGMRRVRARRHEIIRSKIDIASVPSPSPCSFIRFLTIHDPFFY